MPKPQKPGARTVVRCIWQPVAFVARWVVVPTSEPAPPYPKAHASATVLLDEDGQVNIMGFTAQSYSLADRHAVDAEAARWGGKRLKWTRRGRGGARIVDVEVK